MSVLYSLGKRGLIWNRVRVLCFVKFCLLELMLSNLDIESGVLEYTDSCKALGWNPLFGS